MQKEDMSEIDKNIHSKLKKTIKTTLKVFVAVAGTVVAKWLIAKEWKRLKKYK